MLKNSKDIIRKLRQDGWELIRTKGDNHIFKHPIKKGIVIVTHPCKDIPIGTVRSIYKMAGWIEME